MSEAKQYYRKALEIREKLAREIKTVSFCADLAGSYFKVGCLGEQKMMQSAYELYEKLANRYPQIERFARDRDMAKKALADLENNNNP